MWSHLMFLSSIFPILKFHNLQFIFISSWCPTSYFNVKYQTAYTILVFLSRWYHHFCNGRIKFMYLIKKMHFCKHWSNFSQSLCLAGFCPCLSQSRDFWCPFWTILCPSEGFWAIFRSSEGSCPYPTQSRGCLSPFSACKQNILTLQSWFKIFSSCKKGSKYSKFKAFSAHSDSS